MATQQAAIEERPSPSPSQQSSKQRRVPACVLCQQRKVKCDRQYPCSGCLRSGSRCVPPAEVARRRQRFPERKLLEQLRHYEGLLRQNNIRFEPLHSNQSKDEERHGVTPQNALEDYASPSQIEVPDNINHETANSTNSTRQEIPDSNGANEFSDDEGNVRDVIVQRAWTQHFENDDHLLFGSRNAAVDISVLHPDPVQIFRLWQVYLENVDPLLKVTHTPSLQGRIIEAASDLSRVSTALEALLFSIYCISVLSLSAENCRAIFGSTKEDLLTKFHFACQQALVNCGFLRSSDRESLTALYLYIVSIRPKTNPHSLSSLLGVAVRIAQRMGLNNDVILAKHTVLEAELRRRLWWSLVLFDTRISEMADFQSVTLTPTWDCRPPLNVNDSDLRPTMKEAPQPQIQSSTDAIFAVVRGELADFLRHTRLHLGVTDPRRRKLFAMTAGGFQKAEDIELRELQKKIDEKYLRFCDPGNPLHCMTIWLTRATLAKCRLVQHIYSCYVSSEQTDAQRVAGLSYALDMLRCDTEVVSSPLTAGFLWFVHCYFPFLAYIHVVQYLKRRPISDNSDQAWNVMTDNYEVRFGRQNDYNPFLKIFAQIVLQAWEVRKNAFQQEGANPPLPIPGIVSAINEKMALTGLTTQSQGAAPATQPGFMENISGGGYPTPVSMGMGSQYENTATPLTNYDIGSNQLQSDLDLDLFGWPAMNWGFMTSSTADANSPFAPWLAH